MRAVPSVEDPRVLTISVFSLVGLNRRGRAHLDLLEQLGHLVEVEACVDGAVDTLHGKRLVGGQGVQVGEVWL